MRTGGLGLSSALLLLGLSGCAIMLKMPAGRFESPETIGVPWKKEIGFASVQGSHDFNLTSDFSTSAVNLSNPYQSQSYFNYGAKASVAASESVDLSLRYVADGTPILQFKHQWLGRPMSEVLEQQFAASFMLGVGYAEASPSKLLSNGTTTVTNSHVTEILDVSVSLGYRMDHQWLVYLSPFFTFYHLKGEREVTGVSVPTLTEYSGSGRSLGYAVGVEWLPPLPRTVVRVEGCYNKAGLNTHSETGFFLGAELSYLF